MKATVSLFLKHAFISCGDVTQVNVVKSSLPQCGLDRVRRQESVAGGRKR